MGLREFVHNLSGFVFLVTASGWSIYLYLCWWQCFIANCWKMVPHPLNCLIFALWPLLRRRITSRLPVKVRLRLTSWSEAVVRIKEAEIYRWAKGTDSSSLTYLQHSFCYPVSSDSSAFIIQASLSIIIHHTAAPLILLGALLPLPPLCNAE